MSKGQRIHKKKNPLQIWHLSVQVEIPVAAAWLAEIPSTCSPSMAQDDLQPFGKTRGIWVSHKPVAISVGPEFQSKPEFPVQKPR